MSGNTKYVADYIASKLDVTIIEINPQKAYPNKGIRKFYWGGKSAVMGETPKLEEYTFDSSKYDYIIIGSPIWASNVTPPIKTFIKENKENIKNKKIAIYTCYSGGGAQKAIEKLKKELEIDNFIANLIIINPKDKQSTEKDKQIDVFCQEIINGR